MGFRGTQAKALDIAINAKDNYETNALFLAIREDEETAIALIDNCQRLTLSLSETNENKETPLILACKLKKPKIV